MLLATMSRPDASIACEEDATRARLFLRQSHNTWKTNAFCPRPHDRENYATLSCDDASITAAATYERPGQPLQGGRVVQAAAQHSSLRPSHTSGAALPSPLLTKFIDGPLKVTPSHSFVTCSLGIRPLRIVVLSIPVPENPGLGSCGRHPGGHTRTRLGLGLDLFRLGLDLLGQRIG